MLKEFIVTNHYINNVNYNQYFPKLMTKTSFPICQQGYNSCHDDISGPKTFVHFNLQYKITT